MPEAQPEVQPKVKRCSWVNVGHELMREYHDREWGVPTHDDRRHFEFLILEAAQAGLSWSIVLSKREGYRRAFSQFDPKKVARYSQARIDQLTVDPGIIRNRVKIVAAVKNARAFLAVQEEFGSFDAYCWQFVDGRPRQNRRASLRDIPATTPESDAFSSDLKRRGFSFVGSTVIYGHMQAVGMVNDHQIDCFRYRDVRRLGTSGEPPTRRAR
jgi:DNA-3-methyladenine glycosylase I